MRPPFSTFEELETFFLSLASPGIRPGLERIALLLEKLGHPERAFPAIHIVGTNGKGSTAAFSERILRKCGYSTALYTSPHLDSPAERLLVNGKPLSSKKWSRCAFDVEEAIRSVPRLVEEPPTFFEIVTATAFLLTARAGVEIAVVEAGLGGRLDATNLLGDVRLTLVTSISMDHMEFLGSTLEQIASEKFAVMREGVPAVFSGSPTSLISLFRTAALFRGALPHVSSEECSCENILTSPNSLSYDYRRLPDFSEEPRDDDSTKKETFSIRTSLTGIYQIENSSLAVTGALLLAESFPRITLDIIQAGVAESRWPGRFETIEGTPPLILDGGHNPGGVEKLMETLSILYGDKRIGVVYACMKDKAFTECLALFQRGSSKLYCTSVPGNPRSAAPDLLVHTAISLGWDSDDVYGFPEPLDALKAALASDEVVVCCGSLYLIGYLRKYMHLLPRRIVP